jgi:hypothetical protein
MVAGYGVEDADAQEGAADQQVDDIEHGANIPNARAQCPERLREM